MTKKAVIHDTAQIERFKEAARALGCDDDEAAFDEKLKALAQQKPTLHKPVSKGKGRTGRADHD